MNKRIAVIMMMSLFLASTTVSEAGPLIWLAKTGKSLWTKTKSAGSTAVRAVENSGKLAYGLSTIVVAGATIRELQAAPVEPEIRTAINNGETEYQTRECYTPEGIIQVPEYFQVCPDGSQVSYGSVIDLTRN